MSGDICCLSFTFHSPGAETRRAEGPISGDIHCVNGSALVGCVDQGYASSRSHWVASGLEKLEGLIVPAQHDLFW